MTIVQTKSVSGITYWSIFYTAISLLRISRVTSPCTVCWRRSFLPIPCYVDSSSYIACICRSSCFSTLNLLCFWCTSISILVVGIVVITYITYAICTLVSAFTDPSCPVCEGIICLWSTCITAIECSTTLTCLRLWLVSSTACCWSICCSLTFP